MCVEFGEHIYLDFTNLFLRLNTMSGNLLNLLGRVVIDLGAVNGMLLNFSSNSVLSSMYWF